MKLLRNKKAILPLVLLMLGLLAAAGCGGQGNGDAEHSHGHHGDHEHGDLPYEWSGDYTFAAETYTLEFQESGDPSCAVAFVLDEGDRHDLEHHAHHVMEAHMEEVEPGGHFTALPDYGYVLVLDPGGTTFTFEIEVPGDYVFFTEHYAWEFDLKVLDSGGQEVQARNIKEYECGHDHH